MAVSELISFNGGLSTKTSPHLITRNEGVVCENVDLEYGTLMPFDSLTYNSNVNGEHLYIYDDKIIANQNSNDNRMYASYAGRIYWSDKGYTSSGVRKYNGTDAGISADAPATISDITKIHIVECTLSDNAGQMTLGGSYLYAFTLTNSEGIESAPTYALSPVVLNNENKLSIKIYISKTDIATVIPSNHTLNIYRTGGNNPTFNLIAEGLTSSTMIDGNVVSACGSGNYCYRDTIADINVSRIELYTAENTSAISSLDMLIENYGTFYGSHNNRVYFSRTGSAEFWNQLDFVTLNGEVAGLGKFSDTIIAFTKTSAYQISGYSRDTIQVIQLPFNQGCTNKHSVVNIDAYLVWASMNGICLWNGSEVQVITKKTLSWDEFGRLGNTVYGDYDGTYTSWASGLGFDIQYAVGYQDKYYGVFNNGIMILDMANGLRVSTLNTPNVKSVAINKEDNIVYVCIDKLDGTYDVYSMTNTSSKMEATWKTGRIYDSSINVRKHYRQVELDGLPISVKVFIDGVYKYTAYNKSKFMLPSGLVGRDIQFEIKTINEIRGLKYQFSELKP